ncbi:MAG: amidase [Bacteroidales bacterium]|nr:amidase [Bacteroidales bacterium]
MKYLNQIKLSLFILLFTQISCQQAKQEVSNTKSAEFTLLEYDISQIQEGYKTGAFNIQEVVHLYLNRIEELDKNGPEVNAIIQINPDAIAIAKELDDEMKNGNIRGPLHGIPILLKDNIDTHDQMATTAGSRALANSFPLQDSHIAKLLRESGAVILGKANLSEWANFRGELSTSGWSGLGGQTKNPYELSRNPCGSSSGSAVAVSANFTILAIGTETNGSVVCPSSANGIVGIKPTVGLSSRSGIIPISFTQDTPGPMARNLTDAVICLGAIVGVDSLDSKTFESLGKHDTDYTQFLNKDGLKGKRIGLYKAPFGINYKVDHLMNEAVEYMKSQGVEIIEIEEITQSNVGENSFKIMLFEYKDGLNKYFQSLGPHASINNLEDLIAFNKADQVELKHFGQQYLEMAQEMGDLSDPEYQEALSIMLKGSRQEGIDRVMDEHHLDAIIAPTGSPAWKTDWINGDSYVLGTSSPAAQSGYPNITIPMGFIGELPIGISFFGRAWSEGVLIEMAYAYEQGTLHRKAPKFLTTD